MQDDSAQNDSNVVKSKSFIRAKMDLLMMMIHHSLDSRLGFGMVGHRLVQFSVLLVELTGPSINQLGLV